jgi:hypothetical protein
MPPPTVTPTPPPSIEYPVTPPEQAPPPSYQPPTYAPEPTSYSGPSQADYDAVIGQVQQKESTIAQLQNQFNEVNAQCASLNAQLLDKDNQLNQLTSQIQNLQGTIQSYQNQITQSNEEKAQLQALIPQLQSQLQQIQQENMNMQQQIGPMQAQINKLQEEVSYKDRRIQELKEPKAVMPSSLAQGITSQTTQFGSSPSFGTSTPAPTTPIPATDASGLGSGRKICPNCGATGFAIKEVEDKSKIISYIPKPIYAKKLLCSKCGFEF